MFIVQVIDEGCWLDPTLYGPFASEADANAYVKANYPGICQTDDPTEFSGGFDTILILPVAKP